SNPLLRLRVVRKLGLIAHYDDKSPTKPEKTVQGAIEAWFQKEVNKDPRFVEKWAAKSSTLAEQWVKDNTEAVAGWLRKSADEVKKNSGDATKAFFPRFVKKHPAAWPIVEEQTITEKETKEAKTIKVIKPGQKGSDIQSYFFEPWLESIQDEIKKGSIVLKQVPADMVMSSGSGLDPHITRDSADYQLDDVVDAWAEKL